MSGTRRRLNADVRREQILETASRLFIERGFESVKMADIAEELQTSRPNIYTYYPSTEAILDVILERRTTEYVGDLGRLLLENPSFDVTETLRTILKHQELLLLLFSGGGPLFRERRSQVNKTLDDHNREYLRGHLPKKPIDLKPQALDRMVMIQRNLLLNTAYEIAMNPQLDVEELGSLLDTMLRAGFEVSAAA